MANNLVGWDPDNESKWKNGQEAIAKRNLWISIPSLLCGFAIWVMWSIITVQMLNTGYGGFDQSQLFTLTAIAGLSGATLRIPSTFFIPFSGWQKQHIHYDTAPYIASSWGWDSFI